MKDLPNILTFSRIVAIPFVIGFLMLPYAWAVWTALGIYTYAALTDFFDGYLAREMNTTSAVGKFMDPIADKLIIAALILVLAGIDRFDGFWIIPALAILVREIFIAGLREFLGPMNISLPVSRLAKWKTASQMIAMGFLIVGDGHLDSIPVLDIGHILITIAAVLSVITGWSYSKIGLQKIIESDRK